MSVRADAYQTVYLKSNVSYGVGFAGATWVDATGEDVAIDDPARYDFVIRDNLYINTKNGETINAHKITVGEIDGTVGNLLRRYNATFNTAEGLVLAKGSMYTTTVSRRAVDCRVTVTAPASAPFLLTTTGDSGGGLDFTGDFIGAKKTALHVNSPVSGYYTVVPNAAGYHGDVEVTATNTTGAAADARLVLAAVDAGTVRVGANCTLEFTNAAAQASVASLVLSDGSTLKFDLPSAPCGAPLLVVGESLSKSEGARLTFDVSAVVFPNGEGVTYPILSAPEGMLSDDTFAPDTTSSPQARPALSRTVDQETGMATLWGTFYPTVNLLSADGNSLSEDSPSAMTNALQWSDGRVVHAGAHYALVQPATLLRTPWCPEGSFVFPGESLTVGYKCHFYLACRDFWCPLLYLPNSTTRKSIKAAEGSDVTFHGNIELVNAIARLEIYSDHCFTVDGELKGSGSVLLVSGSESSAYDGSHRGDFMLARGNTSFKGKIALSSISADKRLRWSAAEPYAHVWYSDATSFGGPMDAFAHDALTIEKMARLITTNEVTFGDMTRGWFLSDIAQLETPMEGDSLTLLQPVTVNGSVYKQGAGRLAMGGTLKFLDAEGTLTDTPPDEAAKRTLFVQGGAIKPLSADAFNGLDIVFSNSVNVAGVKVTNVALEIDIDAEDADLRTYGLRNTKSPSPLALSLADGAMKVPVRLIADAAGLSGICTVGVMTVKSDIAEETFAKLNIVKPAELSVRMTKNVTTDAAKETSTLSVMLKPSGFSIVFR